jgi:ribonuclease G
VIKKQESGSAVVHCHSAVADWIYEEEQEELEMIEEKIQRPVILKVEPGYHVEQFEIFSSLKKSPPEPGNT